MKISKFHINPNMVYRIQLITTFINCYRCATPMQDNDIGYWQVVRGLYKNFMYFLLNFSINQNMIKIKHINFFSKIKNKEENVMSSQIYHLNVTQFQVYRETQQFFCLKIVCNLFYLVIQCELILKRKNKLFLRKFK